MNGLDFTRMGPYMSNRMVGNVCTFFSLETSFISLTKACGTVEGTCYCNLEVVGSSHVTNKRKSSFPMVMYCIEFIYFFISPNKLKFNLLSIKLI